MKWHPGKPPDPQPQYPHLEPFDCCFEGCSKCDDRRRAWRENQPRLVTRLVGTNPDGSLKLEYSYA